MILMFEMTFSSEDHGDAKLVAFLDGILVADGSARLHDGFHAVLGRQGMLFCFSILINVIHSLSQAFYYAFLYILKNKKK